MTTIILTIIGILLAAAAALMVIFYGGDAFNSGSVGAQANTYQNAGTNVISAVQMYKAETAKSPANLTALSEDNGSGKYLDEQPALPEGIVGTLASDTYTVAEVPGNVCVRINKNLKNTTVPTATTDAKMGCIPGADVDADGQFFANA